MWNSVSYYTILLLVLIFIYALFCVFSSLPRLRGCLFIYIIFIFLLLLLIILLLHLRGSYIRESFLLVKIPMSSCLGRHADTKAPGILLIDTGVVDPHLPSSVPRTGPLPPDLIQLFLYLQIRGKYSVGGRHWLTIILVQIK